LTEQEIPDTMLSGCIRRIGTSSATKAGDNDLSSCSDYGVFRELLMWCLHRCYEALLPGGRLAVLIGDVRRQERYTAIIRDILNFPEGEIRSIIIKVQHNCVSDRRSYGRMEDVPIKHEYCVIFRKPGVRGQRGREWGSMRARLRLVIRVFSGESSLGGVRMASANSNQMASEAHAGNFC